MIFANKIPFRLGVMLRNWKGAFVGARYRGDNVTCPVCRHSFSQFLGAGNEEYYRKDARCPRCGAVERHRILWLYLNKHTNIFSQPCRVLHFAPERCLYSHFVRAKNIEYVNGDKYAAFGDISFDITDLNFAEQSFDYILCNHVLEHIEDDAQAISELYRVTKPGGTVIIMLPTKGRETFEDPEIVTEEDRLKAYGQRDHVRIYGLDFVERLKAGGFRVDVLDFLASETPQNIERQKLRISSSFFDTTEYIFVARRQD